MIGGLRWDRFQASINNTISLPGYASQTNFFTSVRAGLIYQPTDWQSYYVSYGTSFNPSLENADGDEPDAEPRAGIDQVV